VAVQDTVGRGSNLHLNGQKLNQRFKMLKDEFSSAYTVFTSALC
jgi:hypothetical protein